MNFLAFSFGPPLAGELLTGAAVPDRAALIMAVAASIPVAVADNVVLRLEADGVTTGVTLTIVAGQVKASAAVASVAVAADALLRWRCTACGAVVAAPVGVSASASLVSADATPLAWSVLFASPGPVFAGDAGAARLFGLVVLPEGMATEVVEGEGTDGGGGETVFALHVNGAPVAGRDLTFAAEAAGHAHTVAAAWAVDVPAGALLTVAAVSGPAAAEGSLVNVALWLRLVPRS